MNFKSIKLAVAKQFERMSKHDLFRVSIPKDDLWDNYLAGFPAGSNPIYKTRTEHDCQCCKQFIRAVGNVVAIIDGKIETIWDGVVDDPNYAAVCQRMSGAVRAFPITDVFLHYEKTAGTDRSLQDTLDGVKAWDHFFVNIPTKFVKRGSDIPTLLNDHRTAYAVFKRGLEEISYESIETVLELISQNSLYRGEEHKFAVEKFKAASFEAGLLPVEERESFYWLQSLKLPPSVSRIRNTSIGTLLVDLSEGKEMEDAVRAFEAMVAPANYKRPTALVTKAMIEKAKAKVQELSLGSALERRYATIQDISINNVLFADRSARKAMGESDPFDIPVAANTKTFDKVEEVPIERFLSDILPQAKTIEVMVENRHSSNLVSLVAPADPTALPLFKWANNFSWSYNGDVADSMKERVKKAGGKVEGDLCCRLAWDYTDDLDFHFHGSGIHIYYGDHRGGGGHLDVDANGMNGIMTEPVENIVFPNKSTLPVGKYELYVHNYSRREPGKSGFQVEVEIEGTTYSFDYAQAVGQSQKVAVAEITKGRDNTLSIKPILQSTAASKEVWGLSTQQFHRVNAVMLSPNHWDGQGVGNRHFFFMLDGCRNDGTARGFYNEFLKSDLNEHRKVFEIVGSKMKTEAGGDQLSGLGFSSTQRNSALCKVTGAFTRVVKIVF